MEAGPYCILSVFILLYILAHTTRFTLFAKVKEIGIKICTRIILHIRMSFAIQNYKLFANGAIFSHIFSLRHRFSVISQAFLPISSYL